MPRKSQKGKSLAEVNTELAKEWHPTKNGDLTPFDVSIKHSSKVWWKCPKGDDHEWFSSVNERNRGRGCTICSGKKVVLSNCLQTLNPTLAKEWHPTKNEDLTPLNVSPGSNKKVWWKCKEKSHPAWQTSISHRNNGTNCPFCSGTNKKDTNWFINKAKSIHGDKFDYSNSKYINSKTKIEIRCIKHNNIFHQLSYNHFKKGFACKDCLIEHKRSLFSYDTDTFVEKSISLFGNKYDYSSVVYVNQKTEVKIRCKKHDFVFKKLPILFLKGSGCVKCSKENIISKRSDETLLKIRRHVKKLGGKCLSKEYFANDKNLLFECKYGHKFKESWSDVKNSLRWCPKCSKNRLIGESIARQIMEHSLQLEFPSVYLKEMEGLQLDGYNDEHKIAFEYQGYQHYTQSSHFHQSDNEYDSQVDRDKEKKRLCDKNGIKLIEIFEFKTIRKNRIQKFYKDVCGLLLSHGFTLNTSPFELDLIDLYRGKVSENYKKAKNIVEERGGTIQEYIGSESYHSYTCKYGHITNGRVLSVIIKSKGSCPECEDIQYLERLKDSVEKRGGVLHENRWKGVHEYYKWECEKGHKNESRGNILLNHWCRKCQNINSMKQLKTDKININDNFIERFINDCISGKFYQSEILNKYNITYGPFRRILNENNIVAKYKQDYRTKQDISKKSKGALLQIHPETFQIVREYKNLESVKRDKSNRFNPESIRFQMKRFKKSYGFYWCRKNEYKDYIKKINPSN